MIDLTKIFSDEHISGASFISIDTVTTPVLKGGKKNEYQGRVKKVMQGASVMVFQNKKNSAYGAMVERRLLKEGKDPASFTLGPRVWGERIPNTPVVEHKGQQYLECIFLRPGSVAYMVEGVEIDPRSIPGLELDREEGEQGGLEDKVVIRCFKGESIAKIRIDGNEIVNPAYA